MYVISPHFLKPIVAESNDFSFAIKGYPTVSEGRKHFTYTNIEDIMGFIFCFYELPKKLRPLADFVSYLDTLCDKPVVICCCEKDGMDLLLKNIVHDRIKLFVRCPVEDMTDVVIRRDLFGTIIRETLEPYPELTPKEEPKQSYVNKSIRYESILPNDIDRLYESIPIVRNYALAVKSDKSFLYLKDRSELLAYLRRLQIQVKYSCVSEDDRDRFNNLVADDENRLFYKSLYELVREGKV